jgi:hypothetical protein
LRPDDRDGPGKRNSRRKAATKLSKVVAQARLISIRMSGSAMSTSVSRRRLTGRRSVKRFPLFARLSVKALTADRQVFSNIVDLGTRMEITLKQGEVPESARAALLGSKP